MPGRRDFMDELYTETMSEMAENFFHRRKEMENRLDGFARLEGEVRALGIKALRRWKTFFLLLVDEDAALEFCREAGMEAGHIPTLSEAAGPPWRFKTTFALTRFRRYRWSVRYTYQALRQASQDYLEGSYGMDPKNPMKKILLPNYSTMKNLAETINSEVKCVNTGQCPSAVLCYVKSLDQSEISREAVTGGGVGEDMTRLDDELAFKPVDFEALKLPVLPMPAPLEDVQSRLDALCESIYDTRGEEALRALALVTLH